MKRNFDDAIVSQRTSDSFFNATEMLQYFNNNKNENITNKVLAEFFSNQGTQGFIEALKNELLNIGDSLQLEVIDSKRGRYGATWVHPYLFVKFCFWLSPEFEVKVIKWVYDNLIDFRHQAGDHYKEMCDVMTNRYEYCYGSKPDPLLFVKEANYLNKLVFGEVKGGKRDLATEQELDLMNRLQILNINMLKQKKSKDERHRRMFDFTENFKLTIKN
jgi:hypothetical protein